MNVIVVSLDCVRPEALSCYPESFSYRHQVPYRARTPNLDEIAADGLVYRNTICQAPFTPASHASLFTGENPYHHGIRGMFNFHLSGEVETMAERFSAAGYDTGGFIGAHALSSRYGLNRGFETYDEAFDTANENWVVGNRRPCTEVTDEAIDWLSARDGDYLLFVHYFDAHDGGETAPYQATDSNDGDDETKSGGVRGLYDDYARPLDEALRSPIKRAYRMLRKLDPNKAYGRRYHLQQVQRIDRQLGRLVDLLQERGEYEETTIVVTADHGDAFGEHGEYGHRKYIYDTTIRVPMVFKPGASVGLPRRSSENLVRSIDVYPTLADAADVGTDSVAGRSLYRAASSDELKAYVETRYERSPDDLDDLVTDLVGLRGSRWKLIRDRLTGSYELYDIENDPGERRNVANEYPDVRAGLMAELDELLADAPDKAENLLTDAERVDVRDHLEGLGYL